MTEQLFKSESVLPDHPFLSRYSEQFGNVKGAKTFYVDGTAFLVNLVVELRVDHCDLISLSEFKGVLDLVDAFFHTPLDEIPPHLLDVYEDKLTRAAEPQVIVIIKALIRVVTSSVDPLNE